jgi:hypothetical protein
MDRILHKDFVLVLGDGRTATRDDLIGEARNKTFAWDKQDEEAGSQVVRMYGDAAIVTAKLWVKGTKAGVAFDRTLWFSDTYVRTKDGWKYAFGQASLALPAIPSHLIGARGCERFVQVLVTLKLTAPYENATRH